MWGGGWDQGQPCARPFSLYCLSSPNHHLHFASTWDRLSSNQDRLWTRHLCRIYPEMDKVGIEILFLVALSAHNLLLIFFIYFWTICVEI